MVLAFLKDYANIVRSKRFLQKQANDIKTFGENNVRRKNVSDELLDAFTPYRRASQKKCTLSDSKYFITKYEQETGNEYLPLNWSNLTEEEKIDFIVKDRYSKLVSHKIMNKIHREKDEHLFSLDSEGNIVFYKKGNDSHCSGFVPENGTSVHNHTGFQMQVLQNDELDYVMQREPKLMGSIAFSGEDIKESFVSGERRAFVVDAMNNRFVMEISRKIREMNPFARLQEAIPSMGIISKGDKATMYVWNLKFTENDERIEKAFKIATEYKNKKGTADFSEEKYKELVGNLALTKAKALPDFTWREEILKELGKECGFKFKEV